MLPSITNFQPGFLYDKNSTKVEAESVSLGIIMKAIQFHVYLNKIENAYN